MLKLFWVSSSSFHDKPPEPPSSSSSANDAKEARQWWWWWASMVGKFCCFILGFGFLGMLVLRPLLMGFFQIWILCLLSCELWLFYSKSWTFGLGNGYILFQYFRNEFGICRMGWDGLLLWLNCSSLIGGGKCWYQI